MEIGYESKLVVLILNASAKNTRSRESDTWMADGLRCVYIDYNDVCSLLEELPLTTVDDEMLNGAAYEALRNMAEAQLSFGGSAFMVSPIEPHEYRAHLNGLVALADEYGVPLTVIEVSGGSEEDESEVNVVLNDIPHLILPLWGANHNHDSRAPSITHSYYPIKSFIEYFSSTPEFTTNGGDSISNSAKFRHFGHCHPLLLNTSDKGIVEKADHCCSVCTTLVTAQPYYSCPCCGFYLHKQCAELPQHVKSPIHSRPLRLVIALWEKNGNYLFSYGNYPVRKQDFGIKCLVCNSRERLPFYGCFYCPDLFAHHKCIHSFQHVIHHWAHPHPLTMEMTGNYYRCYACGGVGHRISYRCRECDFDFHLKCVWRLPPSVHHERHKDHPLFLSMPLKDETNEYYCEVCAERRHPDYWICYCKSCEYEAHPHCALEGIPRYTYKEGQEADDDVDDNGEDDPEEDNENKDRQELSGMDCGSAVSAT